MRPLFVLFAVTLLALPLVAKEEAAPAPPPKDDKPMVMIEAKLLRGPISRIATLRGSDSLPGLVKELKIDTEEHVLLAPSLVCEAGNLATMRMGTNRVFTDIAGEEEIPAGIVLEFRPVISKDGESVHLDVDAEVTEPSGDAGFRQIRHRTKIVSKFGETTLVHLGILPNPKAKGPDPEDLPLTLSVTLHLVKQKD